MLMRIIQLKVGNVNYVNSIKQSRHRLKYVNWQNELALSAIYRYQLGNFKYVGYNNKQKPNIDIWRNCEH